MRRGVNLFKVSYMHEMFELFLEKSSDNLGTEEHTYNSSGV